MKNDEKQTPLGQIYLPSAGTGVGRFEFIVDKASGKNVQIGSLVTADTKEGSLIGTVIDMRTVGEGRDPIAADLLSSYEVKELASIGETMLATVQVMKSDAMRPPRAGSVRSATAEEIAEATGSNAMGWKIPVGVAELLNGDFAPIFADGNFLVGPEGAHLLTLGTSGLASKSSFISVVLRSLIHHGDTQNKKVGVLAFNVKGDDLLFLDKPPSPGYELTSRDRRIYEAMGVPATPFEDLVVYSPSLPLDGGTRSSRVGSTPLRWDLTQIMPYLRYIYPWIAADEKVQSFLAEFKDLKMNAKNPHERVETFAQMSAFFDSIFALVDEDESLTTPWRSHHIATLRRIRRMMEGLVARSGGLITDGSKKPTDDVPNSSWQHGQTIVVDIAGMDASMQGVVMARTIDRILKAAEAGTLGVDHVVVMADELNVFAPATGSDMDTVRKILQRVATQGRYAGVSLFGAAQQASKIDALLRDQAGSKAIGNMPDAELSSGAYGRLSQGLIERLATLPKGQMAFTHYSYRAPIVLSFPRPAWHTGKAKAGSFDTSTKKVKRGQSLDVLDLSDKSQARLTEGLNEEAVEQIIASSSSKADAVNQLLDARIPNMKNIALHEPQQTDPKNIFELD